MHWLCDMVLRGTYLHVPTILHLPEEWQTLVSHLQGMSAGEPIWKSCMHLFVKQTL